MKLSPLPLPYHNSKIKIILLLVAVILLAGCAQTQSGEEQPEQPNQSIYQPPTGAPSLKIVSPGNGDIINRSSVGIRLNVTNFRLAAIDPSRPNRQNEGHVHLYLDGIEKMSSLTILAYSDVPSGEHTLRAELRNNDHSQLSTPIVDTVRFTTAG